MKTITGIILLTSLVLAPVVRAENAADLQKLMTTGDCVGCDLQDADLRNLDLRGANLEEVILDNWTIDYWYISNFYQAASFFKKHLETGKFTRPILVVDEEYSGAQRLAKFDPQNKEDVDKLLSLFDRELNKR